MALTISINNILMIVLGLGAIILTAYTIFKKSEKSTSKLDSPGSLERSRFVDGSGEYEVKGGKWLDPNHQKAEVYLIGLHDGNDYKQIISNEDVVIINKLKNMLGLSAPEYYHKEFYDVGKAIVGRDKQEEDRELRRQLEMERGENDRLVNVRLEGIRSIIRAGSSKNEQQK